MTLWTPTEQSLWPLGPMSSKIEVTSGDETATYTVRVTRAAVVAVGATLSALSLSGITLSPPFASATLDYKASVVDSFGGTTTVTTTAAEDATTVITQSPGDTAALVADGVTTMIPVTLVADGETTITVKVTTEDATNFYTITVTRGPASADATLTVLGLGDNLTFGFSKNTFSYSPHRAGQDWGCDGHDDAGPGRRRCGG